MATRISLAARNAAVNSLTALLDAGVAAGFVEIRTGTQPANPDTAATGTLLGTLVLSDPAFAAAVNGTATANPIADDVSADATGTAGWFRAYDSASTAVIDGSITATGGTGDMKLDNTSIVAQGNISIESWTITMPSG